MCVCCSNKLVTSLLISGSIKVLVKFITILFLILRYPMTEYSSVIRIIILE